MVPASLPPATWRRELGHLARSGSTLAFNQLLQLVIPFVTTSMTGRLGVDSLAAGSIVGSIALLLFITSLGVMQGLVPALGVSLGANDHLAAGRTMRGGLVLALIMGLVATLVMAAVPAGLAWAGQDPAVVAPAGRYVVALLPGYLPSIMAVALRYFLVAAHDLRWLNPIILVGMAFNIACNLALAAGAPAIDGMTAIGLTVAATNWIMFGLLAIALWRSRRVPRGVLDLGAGFAMRDALSLGIPVGAVFFTETLLMTGSSVLMGYFGTVALAAHGIVLLWLNIALMVPIGISQAAMARVASLLGQRDVAAARQAVRVALVVGTAASLVMAALLIASSDNLARLTLWSRSGGGEEVVATAGRFFQFCAIAQAMSGMVIVMASILRGMRDANTVLWLVMLGYWGVGLGGSILLAFGLGFGGTGIWLGIILAFGFAVTLLAVRFVRALPRLGQPARP